MPTSLSPTDVANIALSKVGAETITSLQDASNRSAIACNQNLQLAYLEVSRSGRWNCLMTPGVLVQVPQTPITPPTPPTPFAGPWAPNTAYAANVFISYGGYYYEVMYAYTSSTNFLNDLTSGPLTQQNLQTSGPTSFPSCDGSQYPSSWAFQYQLPADFQLLCMLNENMCWDFDGAGGDDYEIMGEFLYCNESQAVIQYVKNQPDTTQWDSLFTSAVTFMLASMISTTLRQDGGKLQVQLLELYSRALSKARTKNGGEQMARRFSSIRSSRFLAARYGGINGRILIPKFIARLLGWSLG